MYDTFSPASVSEVYDICQSVNSATLRYFPFRVCCPISVPFRVPSGIPSGVPSGGSAEVSDFEVSDLCPCYGHHIYRGENPEYAARRMGRG